MAEKFFPSAQPCPTPLFKDIGETIKYQQGFDIREWMLAKIPFALHPILTPPKSNTESVSASQPIETIKESEKSILTEISRDEITAAPIAVDKGADD